MLPQCGGLPWLLLMVTTLYIVQGLVQGLCSSIPIYLASYKASWKQQGTFSWVSYPLSLKILWAPLIDAVYSHRLGGRQQTWLAPIQLTSGMILIITSFYLKSLLVNLHVASLTAIFFLMYFLISAHDIVVDGWSVTLFTVFNPQWSSTCQIVGGMLGAIFRFDRSDDAGVRRISPTDTFAPRSLTSSPVARVIFSPPVYSRLWSFDNGCRQPLSFIKLIFWNKPVVGSSRVHSASWRADRLDTALPSSSVCPLLVFALLDTELSGNFPQTNNTGVRLL